MSTRRSFPGSSPGSAEPAGPREVSGCGGKRGFGTAAASYEWLSHLFSGGQILAAKRAQLAWLPTASKVLYLGVGGGEDAALAAKRDVRLTCIDISPGMLDQLRRKVAGQDPPVELICQDARLHDRFDYYDVVVCNFFLNCFREPECVDMLRHAARLVLPGGHLLIADVAYPRGTAWERGVATVYLKFAMAFFWLGGMVPLHPIYDYRRYFSKCDLELEASIPHRLGRRGPVVFENLVARRRPLAASSP